MQLKKIILTCVFVLPYFMLGQDEIWKKTKEEVTELLLGEWKTESYTFEGKEKVIDPKKTFGLLINKLNDTLKVSELSYYHKKIQIIDFNLNCKIDEMKSDYFLCIDYKYKEFYQQIIAINSKTLILEEGPNIRTLKKIMR
ncbi:MAG: hypothetical protein AB8B65_15090 [Kordia sp.]|uniref:hypothetical protein n=1 Tax=Kordia sp. TaxID=1965332 RepID=UPI003857FF28